MYLVILSKVLYASDFRRACTQMHASTALFPICWALAVSARPQVTEIGGAADYWFSTVRAMTRFFGAQFEKKFPRTTVINSTLSSSTSLHHQRQWIARPRTGHIAALTTKLDLRVPA